MFGSKPKAHITISRQTGFEEACNVSINVYELDREEIFKAIQEVGEALRMRLVYNNTKILEAEEREKSLNPAVNHKGNKHSN